MCIYLCHMYRLRGNAHNIHFCSFCLSVSHSIDMYCFYRKTTESIFNEKWTFAVIIFAISQR